MPNHSRRSTRRNLENSRWQHLRAAGVKSAARSGLRIRFRQHFRQRCGTIPHTCGTLPRTLCSGRDRGPHTVRHTSHRSRRTAGSIVPRTGCLEPSRGRTARRYPNIQCSILGSRLNCPWLPFRTDTSDRQPNMPDILQYTVACS